MAKIKGAIVVDTERCKGCNLCVVACPLDVIALNKEVNMKGYNYAWQVKEDTCNGCLIHAKDENGETIESEIVTDNDLPFLNCPLDKAVEKMIRCIVSAAHNCY